MADRNSLTHERLLEVLDYDPETGVFTSKQARGRIPAGVRVGNLDHEGYRVLQVDKCRLRCARAAWFHVHGKWPEHQMDHIDGNKDNDRIKNLRDVTPKMNAQNKHGATKSSVTGRLGVYRNGSGFMAQVCIDGKSTYVGQFKTADAAELAATEARRRLYPGFTK